MSTQFTENPRSAKEVIARLGGLGNDVYKKNVIILIEILSKKRFTVYELSLLVLEHPDYKLLGKDSDRLTQNIWDSLHRYRRVYLKQLFDVYRKEWFVTGTIADPKLKYADEIRNKIFGPVAKRGQRRRCGERRLRELMHEILTQKGPMEQRRLVFEIKRHPDYNDMHPDHIAVRKAVNGTLRNSSRKKGYQKLFKKHSEKSSLVKWSAISRKTPPSYRRKPQIEALSLIMSYRRYWSLDGLANIAIQPDSGYKTPLTATINSVRENISQHLRRHRQVRFERIEGAYGIRWRLKRLKRPKITLPDRLSVLELLAEGLTLNHIAELIAKEHPGFDWPTIRNLYSPISGPFSLNNLEGAPHEVIMKAKKKITIAHTSLVEQLKRVHRDPMLKQKRLEACARYHNSRKQDLLNHFASRGIEIISRSPNGWIQIGDTRTPDQALLLGERKEVITYALASLEIDEQQVVEFIFFGDNTIPEAAQHFNSSESEIILILDNALSKLSEKKEVRELL